MEAILDRPVATPTGRRWAGRVLTGIPALFLTFDAAMKLANVPPVREASARLGLPLSVAPVLGVVLLACVALNLVQRTAVLGAVLLTGYLGGAVAMHVRVGDPLVSHTFFPIYVGIMIWAGLALRDPRVRSLLGPAR